MPFNFDEVIERRGTGCAKWDGLKAQGAPADVLPMWVADMDLRMPREIEEALVARCRHGIFGYTCFSDDYVAAVQGWFHRRFGWAIEPSWLITTPGVISGLSSALRTLSRPGDAVIIQTPVYPAFANIIRANDRRIVENPLLHRDQTWTMDFAGLEELIRRENARLLILCSPHNPVSRVWRLEELRQLTALCRRYGVWIISDEIHADFTLDGNRHYILTVADPDFAKSAVICTAPSKTFNIAGLVTSNIFIADDALRGAVAADLARSHSVINSLGMVACQAAYEHGDAWLDALLIYLAGNRDLLVQGLAQRLPEATLSPLEGTYLGWLDFTRLFATDEEFDTALRDTARLWLNQGSTFGTGGSRFARINLACPRRTVAEAVERLARLSSVRKR